ncbi:MAG TPA: hypothetical protein VFW96_04915 [Thermomicrobiales bacterium]|nr:hypothetical protein [Thermomicrobiales bacterium]
MKRWLTVAIVGLFLLPALACGGAATPTRTSKSTPLPGVVDADAGDAATATPAPATATATRRAVAPTRPAAATPTLPAPTATSAPPTPPPTATPLPPTPVPPTATAVPAAVPRHVAGSGQQTPGPVTLEAGLALFFTTYQGDANFVVELLDLHGQQVGLVVNVIDTSKNTRAIQIPAAGQYVLSVVIADGAWTIDILQPGPAEFAQAVALPRTFTGHGDQTTVFFAARPGLLRVKGRQTGESNFIVELLDTRGDLVGLAANVVGAAPSSQVVPIPTAGVYIFNVTADGDWSLDVSQ